MESLSGRHLISTTQIAFPVRYPSIPVRTATSRTRFWHFRFTLSSKLSDFQDYWQFAKPSRLLPAKEVKICPESSPEKIFTSLGVDESQVLYKIKLHTGAIYGSSLSDLSAGILVCLIGENNVSILQRISASLGQSTNIENTFIPDVLHFQRGSVNEFTFEGPKLGKIKALWVGLESGQWRLGGVSLTVVTRAQPPVEETVGEEIQYSGIHYDFDADDILLGEGSNISMAELRPCCLTEFSEVDPFSFLNKSTSPFDSPAAHKTSNAESMKEYADLKLSLLLYDGMLVSTGTSIILFSVGEKAAVAFLTGGVGGFLYLLFLQRSVDELPAQTSSSSKGMFGGFKSSTLGLAMAFGVAILAVKYGLGDAPPVALTPKEVIVGMMGFLTCKVAVVWAAFKPLGMGFQENK